MDECWDCGHITECVKVDILPTSINGKIITVLNVCPPCNEGSMS